MQHTVRQVERGADCGQDEPDIQGHGERTHERKPRPKPVGVRGDCEAPRMNHLPDSPRSRALEGGRPRPDGYLPHDPFG